MTSPTSLSHPEHSTPAGTRLLLRDGWTQPIHPTSYWSLHASALSFPCVSLTWDFMLPSLSLCIGFLFLAAENKCHAGAEDNTQNNGGNFRQSETVLSFFSYLHSIKCPKRKLSNWLCKEKSCMNGHNECSGSTACTCTEC